MVYQNVPEKLLPTFFNKAYQMLPKDELDEGVLRVWAYGLSSPDHYTWNLAKEIYKNPQTHERLDAYLAIKARKLLHRKKEDDILAMKGCCFQRLQSSSLLTAMVGTKYFDGFIQDGLSLGVLTECIKNLMVSSCDESEKKRQARILISLGDKATKPNEAGKLYINLEAKGFFEECELVKQKYQNHLPLETKIFYSALVDGAGESVFSRYKETLEQGQFVRVFSQRVRHDQTSEAFIEALLERHKDCVWLKKACFDCLMTTSSEWGKQPRAHAVASFLNLLDENDQLLYLEHCAGNGRVQLMKKVMKNLDVEVLATLRERQGMWNERQKKAFTEVLGKMEKKAMKEELALVSSQKSIGKRRM